MIAHGSFSSGPKANRATRIPAAWLANLTLNLWMWNMSTPCGRHGLRSSQLAVTGDAGVHQ